jgi:LVIVD repeat
MRSLIRTVVAIAGALAVLALPAAAAADHHERPSFELRALGHSPNPGVYEEGMANSDLAFWGNRVFNGSYSGFRIVDVSDPMGPQEVVDYQGCAGNQGDVLVWENILVRSWNSPAPAGATCDGQPVPTGWEGLHVFDITNPQDPALVASVELPCGSHTATAIPDRANERLLVYNQTSGGPCYFFDMVEVPFDDPAAAALIRQQPLEGAHACHDSGVILGDVNLMACASGHMANVFDIGENDTPGGSLEEPEFLYSIEEEGVGALPGDPDPHSGNWHSAAFTWDGEVLILGWEPGGGSRAECEATDDPVTHTMFFYDTDTGEKLGEWTLPRKQSAIENCTIHNYNVVPIRNRYIITSGNYQAGTWVTDFTDPANPFVRAYSDPVGLTPALAIAGAWSSYWYNGEIYESSITEGLNLFRYQEANIRRRAMKLDHLNPQTLEFSVPPLSRAAKQAVKQERRAAKKAARKAARRH